MRSSSIPADIVLHLRHGMLSLQSGANDAALASFQRALIMAPRIAAYARDPRVPRSLQRAMNTAAPPKFKNYTATFVEQALDEVTSEFPGTPLARLRATLSSCGRTDQPYALANQRPLLLYMPDLQPQPWFDPVTFDWVPRVEACFPQIEAETARLTCARRAIYAVHAFRCLRDSGESRGGRLAQVHAVEPPTTVFAMAAGMRLPVCAVQ